MSTEHPTPPSSHLPPPFSAVLIANRGEIAVRICRTLRRMGVRSVVVASIPDRKSLAVRSADEWVLLEGYSASESYLDGEAIIRAAKEKGCDAIHPGYGFLSERADFAERCAAEGITFIGPPPAVLRALGDKSEARRMAVGNGVPVVPGYDGPDDDASLLREAEALGVPLMVKARGGGGGRGMREVFDLAELPDAIASARREALASFGDPGLLLERLLTGAHHVEVQVLADGHGNMVHLGERDCSVQRRRQKLIEETPSPVVDEALRARLTGAALAIVRAAGYVNAGTVEFLVGAAREDDERPFYFLEVNPRLQVEHPVTEKVTGLDLVELQLRVAAGERLPLAQADITFTGHAIEFRINAEDPWDGFRPSNGRIEESRLSGERLAPGEAHGSVRADVGFEAGDVVPTQYDSLVGKLVFYAPTREGALALASGVWAGEVVGLRTNLGLLGGVARATGFVDGEADIGWLERELESLERAAATPLDAWMRAGVEALGEGVAWTGAGAAAAWLDDGQRVAEVRVMWTGSGEGLVSVVGEGGGARPFRVLGGGDATAERVVIGDRTAGSRASAGTRGPFRVVPPPPLPRRAVAVSEGAMAVVAPLSGTVAAVFVAEGGAVEAGQLLALLEAMKMEHRITATMTGVVKRVAVSPGETVREGDVLVELGASL